MSYVDDEWLRIYDRTATLVDKRKMVSREFVWFSDNRLLYSDDAGRKFFITEPNSVDPKFEIVPPDDVPGSIGAISFSPADDKLRLHLKLTQVVLLG